MLDRDCDGVSVMKVLGWAGARNGFEGDRDGGPKMGLRPRSWPTETASLSSQPRKCPQKWGYSQVSRKISVRAGLRGGAGRTRTCNQPIMGPKLSSSLTAVVGSLLRDLAGRTAIPSIWHRL